MIKKRYEKPVVTIERFQANEGIAAGCDIKIGHSDDVCWENAVNTNPTPNAMPANGATLVTDGICYCYHTAPDSGFLAS